MANDIYEIKTFWLDTDSKASENVLHAQFSTAPASDDPFVVAGLLRQRPPRETA